jgi:hypothetical protein
VTETETEAGQSGKPVRVTVSGSAERMKKVRAGRDNEMELGARALWPAQAPAREGLALGSVLHTSMYLEARGSQLLFLLAFCSSGPSRESAALTTTMYFVHKTIIMKGTKSLHKPPFARGR